MEFINLTPHEINIYDTAGTIIRTVPASGDVARCAEKRTDAGTLDGVSITRAEFGEVTGLPDATPDTAYIVSALVLSAVPDRADVFAPGPAVRDHAGRIVGCIGLSCTPAKQMSDPDIISMQVDVQSQQQADDYTLLAERFNCRIAWSTGYWPATVYFRFDKPYDGKALVFHARNDDERKQILGI